MIRTLGLALVAAFTLSGAALAAEAPKPATLSKEQLDRGAKEAPPVVQAAGLTCTITGAAYRGDVPGKDAAGAATKDKAYEVSCQEGLGFLVINSQPKPRAVDCLSLLANQPCALPGNANPKAALVGPLKQAGFDCDVADAVGKGSTASGAIFIEVACKNRLGTVLKLEPGQAPVTSDCAQLIGGNLECKLTTVDQIRAAEKAAITTLVASSGKACAIKDTRTVGRLTSGETAYEVACNDGSGYMILQKADNSLDRALPCANAETIAGGCKLTDATVAQTQEAGTYTRLAKASGFQCDVDKYHYIGLEPKTNAEVVELSCKNRPDGGVALFPADNSPGKVYDCVRAGFMSLTCKLSNPSVVFERYTAALASKGKSTCKVSNAVWLARTTTGDDYIETACSDGLPGWVIEMTPTNQVAEVISCGQGRGAGLTCKLPGNTK